MHLKSQKDSCIYLVYILCEKHPCSSHRLLPCWSNMMYYTFIKCNFLSSPQSWEDKMWSSFIFIIEFHTIEVRLLWDCLHIESVFKLYSNAVSFKGQKVYPMERLNSFRPWITESQVIEALEELGSFPKLKQTFLNNLFLLKMC